MEQGLLLLGHIDFTSLNGQPPPVQRLAVAHKVLNCLLDMVDVTDDPRDLKVVVEVNRAAIDTIRKIRALDAEGPSTNASLSIDVGDGFAELRAAFDERLGNSSRD